MGEMVRYPTNGTTQQGYLAVPSGTGPGVVVIQEWWGLVDHIKDVCDRFASEGFVALAPDLYDGRATKEPDEAGKLLMGMSIADAAKTMSGAVDFLAQHEQVQPKAIGSVGFCAGGNLALLLATMKQLDAAVAFYPYPRTEVDCSRVTGPVLLHIAEHDAAPTPDMARAIVEQVRTAGRDAEMHVYAGTEHAFFNDTRPEVYDAEAAGLAWERTLAFFRSSLV